VADWGTKYRFSHRGFFLVTDKIAEADYFLEGLNGRHGRQELKYYLSAFVSAARSVTFSLQSVMADVPEFSDWYSEERKSLAEDQLARFFVELRNYLQKVGGAPVSTSGVMRDSKFILWSQFEPVVIDLEEVPAGDIEALCRDYFRSVLTLAGKAYRRFDVYVDPRTLFTQRGLSAVGWNIEDLEVALGFERGWTDAMPQGEPDPIGQRLRLLAGYGGDEEMDQWLEKYEVIVDPPD
jgi:hypothetical protein